MCLFHFQASKFTCICNTFSNTIRQRVSIYTQRKHLYGKDYNSSHRQLLATTYFQYGEKISYINYNAMDPYSLKIGRTAIASLLAVRRNCPSVECCVLQFGESPLYTYTYK